MLPAPHGFGTRASPAPPPHVRPRQVHGCTVARVDAEGCAAPREADAIVATDAARAVAVVTADCVPILVCAADAAVVVAVHAGWRGLAAGVVGEAIAAVQALTNGERLRAAIGPHIGVCCYEVDEPVLAPLRSRFGPELERALEPSRPGHHRLDLAALVRADLERGGVARGGIGSAASACTRCDPERFHSYRRDGPAAGRLLHFVRPRP